jgi:hypothetical protein
MLQFVQCIANNCEMMTLLGVDTCWCTYLPTVVMYRLQLERSYSQHRMTSGQLGATWGLQLPTTAPLTS